MELQDANMPSRVAHAPRVRGVPELPPAARLDLVREHDLCQVCLGPGWCQVKGENCRWRNRIRMELCRENKCRRKHHQLLHVEKGLEKERQGE